MSPRTGRPPLEHPRGQKVETRMNQAELDKLDYCCHATNKTRSEIIRTGIDKMYTELRETEQT